MDATTLAHELVGLHEEAAIVPPFSARYAGLTAESGYAAARKLHAHRCARGCKPAGRKIGFTNRTLWERYGVHEPMWAHVYDTTTQHLHGARAASRVQRFAQPKIEPEVILHFARAPRADADAAAILACIDWVAHGFEIVQSNFPGWRFEAADTIADSGLHAALFVGPPVPVERLGRDAARVLESFTLELSCNGQRIDAGRGANVLGSPLLAAAHLVATLARQPASEPLHAGEIVTTGTITDAHAVAAGETWETRLSGIDLPGFTIEFR